MNQRLHLIISGRVQGVFYRASARDEGERLGLTGWVKNLPNDSVEIMAEGSKEVLEELKKWCWKGPPLARVTDIDEEWLEATGEFKGFGISH